MITFSVKNKVVERIVSLLKSVDEKIECYADNNLKLVNVSDIFYIESVDKNAVVYCEKEKYKTKFRLYQINEKFTSKGFVQISKYCILNIRKLKKIKPLLNSRMEAILSNGSRLDITRKYIAGIKLALQENE